MLKIERLKYYMKKMFSAAALVLAAVALVGCSEQKLQVEGRIENDKDA